MSLFGSSPPPPAPPPLPAPLPGGTPPSYAQASAKGGPRGGMGSIPGFGSTLLTSPMGVDESNTNTNKKSLLGQ